MHLVGRRAAANLHVSGAGAACLPSSAELCRKAAVQLVYTQRMGWRTARMVACTAHTAQAFTRRRVGAGAAFRQGPRHNCWSAGSTPALPEQCSAPLAVGRSGSRHRHAGHWAGSGDARHDGAAGADLGGAPVVRRLAAHRRAAAGCRGGAGRRASRRRGVGRMRGEAQARCLAKLPRLPSPAHSGSTRRRSSTAHWGSCRARLGWAAAARSRGTAPAPARPALKGCSGAGEALSAARGRSGRHRAGAGHCCRCKR